MQSYWQAAEKFRPLPRTSPNAGGRFLASLTLIGTQIVAMQHKPVQTDYDWTALGPDRVGFSRARSVRVGHALGP